MIDIRKQWQTLFSCFALSVTFRFLLIPAYFSTDFEVHQNWLHITATLPLSEWYFNEESIWTLDYPPLFAYFEYFLSYIACLIDSSIVETINHHYNTILFQRISVILSELPILIVLCYTKEKIDFTFMWTYFSFGFMLLDSKFCNIIDIHFQYNILMQALFILSVYCIEKEMYYRGGFLFSTLLNFKHIYLYAAGAFFVFLLKNYVIKEKISLASLKKLLKMGLFVLIPFLIGFLPFLFNGIEQINQIINRLFPFKRGVIHEYWAPNFWAIYHFVDKILFHLLRIINKSIFLENKHSLKVLPSIEPLVTIILILIFSLPIFVISFKKKISFHKIVVLSGLIFFLFGYHVHEKAILPYVGLLFFFQNQKEENDIIFEKSTFENTKDIKWEKRYTFAAFFVNLLNLLPLLIGVNEKMLKIILLLLCGAIWVTYYGIYSKIETSILLIGITILLYHELIHPFQSKKVEFLPLMINSVFCALFNFGWTISLYYEFIIKKESINEKNLTE